MSKTVKKIPKDDDKITKLKNKLNDRKQQILRLKRTIRDLEKQLKIEGKDKPKKKKIEEILQLPK
jgi:predicted RNase H-like nuclease (RuvC/YqgF family)